MTNEQAIAKLTAVLNDDIYSWSPELLTAFGMAVDALRGEDAQPTQTNTPNTLNALNCIDRQAAIDLLKQMRKDGDMVPWEGKDVFARIRKLPSAQPELRWIPVSEGLPKEYGEYICTMESGQVQECGFVPENQRGLVDGWSTCEADGHKFLGYADVLAWMPLPEPARLDGE